MRAGIDPAAQAEREKRSGLIEQALVWITARNRASGAEESLGLIASDDDESVAVTDLFTGETRLRFFRGAGGLLSVGPVRWEAGLNIRPAPITLAVNAPAVMAALRQYDARGGKVQVWRRTLSTETRRQIGAPERWIKGFVNRAPMPRAVPGGSAEMVMEVVSSKRLLTVHGSGTKSDESQKRRLGDRLFRYRAGIGTRDVPWGQKEERS